MLNSDLEIYESCDLEKPKFPARSRLYSLEPVGIGTPHVESLTSYIARLSEAHCVTPRILIEREISLLREKSSKQKSLFGVRHHTGEVNGRGKTALELVNLLKKVTHRKDLKFLTLLIWSDIFPRKKLIKNTRHWCPLCYQDSLLNNKQVYEPLIWSLTVIETCPIHKILLKKVCDYCNKQLPPLASNLRIGFCSKCGKWLGATIQHKNQKFNISEEQIKWQNHVINNIEKIILASFNVQESISRDKISESINIYINYVAQGNIAAFARIIGVPKNTVWMWSQGKSIPQIDILLRICYILDISVLKFLDIKKLGSNSLKGLKDYIIVNNCASQDNNRRTRIDDNLIRKYLEQSLTNQAIPPDSLTELSKQLGHDRRVLLRKFPELCRAVSQKYSEYKKNTSIDKINQYCLEVEAIATKLHSQGIYPSEINVSSFIDKPGYFRYEEVRNTLRNFLDTI